MHDGAEGLPECVGYTPPCISLQIRSYASVISSIVCAA
jgi:hypothetical protein